VKGCTLDHHSPVPSMPTLCLGVAGTDLGKGKKGKLQVGVRGIQGQGNGRFVGMAGC
jgi:hypothetical protein